MACTTHPAQPVDGPRKQTCGSPAVRVVLSVNNWLQNSTAFVRVECPLAHSTSKGQTAVIGLYVRGTGHHV
jgi:hypothetical protein